MDEAESFRLYRLASEQISSLETNKIVKICKSLHLPQKILTASLYIFFAAKVDLRIEPDDYIIFSACIELGCKVGEVHRPTEAILRHSSQICCITLMEHIDKDYYDCINQTELDICIILDFNFDIPDFHGCLEALCKVNKFDSLFSRRAWIILNDILTTPLSNYFLALELAHAAVLLSYIGSSNDQENFLGSGNNEIIKTFAEKNNIKDLNIEAVEFISLEILELYKEALQSS